jgi:hypothetical protein
MRPVSVAAQDRETGRLFVEGSAFLGIDRDAHADYQTPVPTSDDQSATVPGGGFAVGTFLAPRVSVRLELAVQGSSDFSYAAPQLISDSLVSTSIRVTDDRRSWATTVLAGYHAERRGRLRLAYSGGVAFVGERTDRAIVISSSLQPSFGPPFLVSVFPTVVQRSEARVYSYRPAVAVGLDAEIGLGTRVAVVPQLRVVAFTGRISIRPGVAIRWTS